MRKFRSHTIIHYLTSKAFVLWVPICMLGIFQLAFSHFAFAVDSNPGTPSSEINVDLVNGIAVRILDEAGQQQIDNINLDLTAIPGGSFVSGKFNVEVSTSNKTGYKLYMDSSYDQSSVMGTTSPDYTTNLVNQVNTSYVIPTLANNVTLSEFQSGSNNSSNKWGYSLDDTTFSPIPVHATPDMVDSSSTPTASTLTPVTIGTNVNMDMASGVYKNQLTFSAVAEPVPTDYTLYFESGTTDTVTNLPETMTYSGVATSHTFTIPATVPSRTGYNFTGYLDESTSTTYQAGDSITVVGDIDYTGSATLTAQWELASYTVNITNNNTTSGASSLSIPYGGSKTVAVTPNSGYYLSGVTCPSGYTCSGYSTDSSQTGTQTVTVKNDNTTTSPVTLSFTGTALSLAQTCNNAATHESFTYSEVAYVKLLDGNCWTKESQSYAMTGGTPTTPISSRCKNSTVLGSPASLMTYYGGISLNQVTGWGQNVDASLNHQSYYTASDSSGKVSGWIFFVGVGSYNPASGGGYPVSTMQQHGLDWALYYTSTATTTMRRVGILCKVAPQS